MKRIIYPGTFNPMTNGHIDLITRALKLFDEVIVAIGYNITKEETAESLQTRKTLCKKVLNYLPNVKVKIFNTLLIDFAKEHETTFILRGIRTLTDLEYEFQMAEMNRALFPEIEYIFLNTCKDYSFISSTLVKEIAKRGGDISHFVPPEFEKFIHETINK